MALVVNALSVWFEVEIRVDGWCTSKDTSVEKNSRFSKRIGTCRKMMIIQSVTFLPDGEIFENIKIQSRLDKEQTS